MENIKCFLLAIFMLRISLSQTFTVNLNDSLTPSGNNVKISTVSGDFEGNIFVCFLDGTAKRFNPNFTSYINVQFPDVVDFFIVRSWVLPPATLSNGTNITSNSRSIAIHSNQNKTIRDINYYTYANEFTYHFNQTMIDEFGVSITLSGSTQYFHVVVLQTNIQFAYSGAIIPFFNFTSAFGANITCKGALHYKYPITYGGDYIYPNYTYVISFSDNKVYKFQVNFVFRFNFTLNKYSYSSSSITYSLMFTAATPITTLFGAGNVVFMQSNSTGATYFYNVNTAQLGSTVNIPTKQIFTFFSLLGKIYILQSNGISTLTYNSTANTLSYGTLIASLPQNNYNLAFGTYINILFSTNQSAIYKSGICTGQSFMNGSVCINYTCSMNNCSACNLSPNFCTICNDGYQINNNYTCSIIDVTSNFIESLRKSLQFLGPTLEDTQETFGDVISIPAARRLISPFFFYFGIFDDLYLYQFHDRLYGTTMNNLFSSICDIQTKKWSFINYQQMLRFLHVNVERFTNITNNQDAYNYFPFKDEDHVDVGPQGIWGNCQNFFVVAIPLTILLFVILRCLFKLLLRFPVSKILRIFEFWPFLFVLLMDGNIQQLGFYMANDWKKMFFFDVASKWIKIQIIFFGFVFVIMTLSLYFLSYGFYSKLNYYIMQNNKNNLYGQTLLMIQMGFKNLYFGVMHSLLRTLDYNLMLSILLINEVIFTIIFIKAISMKYYKFTIKMWIYTVLNMLKMLQMITLFIDYKNINNPTIQAVQLFLIFLEVSLFTLGGFSEFFIMVTEWLSFIKVALSKATTPIVQQENKYLQKKLSRDGVVIYVKNFGENYISHAFKGRRFGIKHKIQQEQKQLAPAFVNNLNVNEISKLSNSLPNLDKHSKINSLQAKKKYLRIKYHRQQTINEEQELQSENA